MNMEIIIILKIAIFKFITTSKNIQYNYHAKKVLQILIKQFISKRHLK